MPRLEVQQRYDPTMTTDEVFMSTTFEIPGYQIDRQLGLCWGTLVRSVGFAKGFTGGFKALSAGEVPQYTDVVNKARETAVERLMEHARALGGNAVLGVRFDSSEMGSDGSMAEILAYGTAVVISAKA